MSNPLIRDEGFPNDNPFQFSVGNSAEFIIFRNKCHCDSFKSMAELTFVVQ